MEIAKLLPFKRVEYRTILFYRYLNYFVSCFLIDLNGIILSAISQRGNDSSSVFKFQSDSPCWNTPLLLWLLLLPRSVLSLSFFLLSFFCFQLQPFHRLKSFLPDCRFFNPFQFQDPILRDKQVNLQPLRKLLPRDECDIWKRIENDASVPPVALLVYLRHFSLVSRYPTPSFSLSLFASIALKTTELRSDSNEVSFVVPSWQMADA